MSLKLPIDNRFAKDQLHCQIPCLGNEANDRGHMDDIPLSPDAKVTVERRGQIVLIVLIDRKISTISIPRHFTVWLRLTTISITIPRSGRRSSLATTRTSPAGMTSRPFPLLPRAGRLSPLVRFNSIPSGGRKIRNLLSLWCTATPGTWVMNSISSPISELRARTCGTHRLKTHTAVSLASRPSA
jgi:hypothetical protein